MDRAAIERATRTVRAGALDLPVFVAGDGPPVLLLHGFPDSRHVWRHQLGALAAAGYRVVAPDLRGFGEAPKPPEVAAYAMRELLADCTGLLDALDIGAARVIGHDWGASLAWSLAQYFPARVERLAVLSVGHGGSRGWQTIMQREKSWYFLFFQFAGIAEAELMHDDWRLMREWAASHPDCARVIADLSRPGALTAGLNWYRANVAPRMPAPPRAPVKVACPVLGLWSEGDCFLTEAQMADSGDCVSGDWRYVRIDGASHWLQIDRPERVNAELLAFLRP